MDQHDAASGITSILHRKGPAIRCANDPLHVSPQDLWRFACTQPGYTFPQRQAATPGRDQAWIAATES